MLFGKPYDTHELVVKHLQRRKPSWAKKKAILRALLRSPEEVFFRTSFNFRMCKKYGIHDDQLAACLRFDATTASERWQGWLEHVRQE
jgi:hypothetical protein